MDNRENVIKGLKKCRRCECDGCTEKGASQAPWDCPAYDDFVDSALALLKEQEAVEPRLDIDALVCGNCGHGLVHQERLGDTVLFEERHNYCPHCGRMVKWE